jgi:hypothetical protein
MAEQVPFTHNYRVLPSPACPYRVIVVATC